MKTIITLLLLTFSSIVFSQKLLSPFLENGKWGYMNEKGEVIIPTSYRNAFNFSIDGYAPVVDIRKSWGFIDAKGEALNIDLKGYIVDKKGFNDGLAIIIYKSKKGVVNTKGEVVIAPEYDLIMPFSDGYTTARKGKEFYILSKDGTSKKVDFVKVNRFSNGLAPFLGVNKKYGFLNTQGEVVIEAQFLGVGHFTGELTWARNDAKKIGFINQKGEWVIEAKYLAAKRMDAETGLARVRDESGWKFVDVKGNEIAAEGAVAYGDFHNGLAWARNSSKNIGFINVKGEWVISPKFIAVRSFSNELCAIKENEKWGFINKKGEWVIQPTFIKVKDFKLVN